MGAFDEEERAALYVHLRAFESDFDKSQSQMRAISSAWSAAVLAAVALITTTAVTPVLVPSGMTAIPELTVRTEMLGYLRAIVCLVGSAGVLAFWYIDQGVYQRLLHSVFAYGMFIESKDIELPQVRSSMFLANLDVTNRLGLFYRAQFWLFPEISVAVDIVSRFVTHSAPHPEVWWIIWLHIAVVIVCELISFHTWPSLDRTVQDFYPELAMSLPTRPAFGIARQKIARVISKILRQPVYPDHQSRFETQIDPNLPVFLARIRHQKHHRYQG